MFKQVIKVYQRKLDNRWTIRLMSQPQLPDEFVTICSCVQEEIETKNSHAFLNLSSASFPMIFSLLRQKELFYPCLYAVVFIEH